MDSLVRSFGPSFKRTRGSAFGDFAFAVATADDKLADLPDQIRACFSKIDETLLELGSTHDNLVSVGIWMADLREKAILDSAWNEWIGEDRTHWPQRSCMGVQLAPGTLVEIQAIGARISRANEKPRDEGLGQPESTCGVQS